MKTETKWERIARQRAEYAEYLATTTDSPKLSEAAFASARVTAKVASTPAPAPAPVAKMAPAPPAPKARRDRAWAGGDRDSDDITYSRGE